MANEYGADELSHEDTPQPGHWSTKLAANEVKPIEPSAPSSIERLGVNTYRRELGRDPNTNKFGKNPYK